MKRVLEVADGDLDVVRRGGVHQRAQRDIGVATSQQYGLAADFDTVHTGQCGQSGRVRVGQGGPDVPAGDDRLDLGGGAVGHDPAGAQQHDPVGVGVGLVEVVGGEEDGSPDGR